MFDRHLKKDEKFYQGQILCNLASVADDLSIKLLTTEPTPDTDNTEVKVVLYRSKLVQLSAPKDNHVQPSAPKHNENVDQSTISHSFSASFGSFENLQMPSKKHLMHKSWGQGSVLTDDIDAATKQDGSGQQVFLYAILVKVKLANMSDVGIPIGLLTISLPFVFQNINTSVIYKIHNYRIG